MSTTAIAGAVRANSTGRVLFASLVGTTIEFFDFYIYATAAVLVVCCSASHGRRPWPAIVWA